MDKKTIEYRLGTIEDKFPEATSTVNLADVLKVTEFKAIMNAINKLQDYKSNRQLINIVFLNNAEIHHFFSKAFNELLQKSISWLGVKDQDLEEIQLHCNRMLLNYLSSARTYIDHSQHFLSARYGKDSRQLNKFKDLLSFNFDHNFSYRFFYKLRNYSQHCGVPIQEIKYVSEYERDNHEIRGHLAAFFQPQQLLMDYNSWGALVKADLEQMQEPLELRPLCESMTAIMYNLNVNFGRIIAPETHKAARYLYNKVKHLEAENISICVFDLALEKKGGELTNLANRPIPMSLVKELMNKND